MYARRMISEEQRSQATGGIADDDHTLALIRKWEPMLEGINDSWAKRCTAVILENEMKHISVVQKRLMESSNTGNVPDLVKFVFPLIRKVWPNLIANNLCSIQPMTSPIGGIFYWDYKYGTTKGTITAGQAMIDNFDPYYSSEEVVNENFFTGAATDTTAGTLDWKPVQPKNMGRVGAAFVATRTGGGKLYAVDNGDNTISGDGTGTINYTSGAASIVWNQADVTGVLVTYTFSMETISANVPEINVDIQLEPVKAIARKLKILWSSEAADDMRAVLNMDIEPELTAGVASEIQLGIDREMIMAMYNSGTTNTDTFSATVPTGINQVDHYRNITTVLSKVSGKINTLTHRGPGNFIIMGPDVAPIFEALHTHGDLKGIFSDYNDGQYMGGSPGAGRGAGQGVTGRTEFALPQAPSGYGVYTMGTLQHKWVVIVDPYFPTGKILVGLKGPMFPDSGLVYSPYVPLEMTNAFLDPADWSLRKGMRTRYAKKMTNNKFYGIITVTGLP